MKLRTREPLIAVALLLAAAPTVRAQVNGTPAELEGIGIDEKPGARPPADLVLRNQDGRAVRLADYFDGRRPVALVLAYYQCPMLCSMVLNGLTEGLKPLSQEPGWTAGDRFRVVTVSFDPRDTAELARAKRTSQLELYGHAVGAAGWDFLVGEERVVKQLAEAVGFRYRWDEKQKQFAHAAGAFVFTPDGRLSRTLYGIQFPTTQLRLALVEASAGKLGNAWDRILLFCYHYDPSAKGYVLVARRVMAGAGVVTMAGLALLLFLLFRPSRKHRSLVAVPGPAPTERPV